MEPSKRSRFFSRLFFAVGLIYVLYACLFILRSSFVIDGVRYFALADDEMIGMRYAKNLADHGALVWNLTGPRVEGYTNLLWVLYMVPFHLLPIPISKISLCIEASGVVFLLLNLIFTKKIAEEISHGSQIVALCAVILTAFYIPLDNWAFQGTEVGLLTLIVSIATWFALRCIKLRTWSIGLYLLLGLATLIRLDMAVFAGVLLLTMAVIAPEMRIKHIFIGGAIVGAFLVAQAGFNLYYYGDLLPNTYYLKVTGYPVIGRLTRGLYVTGIFLIGLDLSILALLLSRVVLHLRRATALLIFILAGQLLYNIYVGGDAWEWYGASNRFFAISMPLFFVLVAYALVICVSRSAKSGLWRSNHYAASFRKRLPAVVIVFVPLLNILALQSGLLDPYAPIRFPGNTANTLSRILLIQKPVETWNYTEHVRQAQMIRRFTDDQAIVAVYPAGAIPYFSGRTAMDLLGKCDWTIAHEPMHFPPNFWIGFLPGHLKWDFAYSIGQKPDVLEAPWDPFNRSPEVNRSLLDGYRRIDLVAGWPWYFRSDSRHVRWPQLEAAPRLAK
jgi:hypothetical protein